MSRVILHADLNNFFASVECLHRPELQNKPVAVCGDSSLRHGIVLAKNYPAKVTGIITGEAIWQAKQKCPGLVVLPPNYPLYLRFSRLARGIYSDYSSQVEPFGLDEAWLDVSASNALHGDGERVADEIRERMKLELGVTASIGVSYNKVFAKLGSDMKKPDATTVINTGNYKDTVWRLPVEDLLYVGRATRKKLAKFGILTIGDLANTSKVLLCSTLGKWGEVLHSFANGEDVSPVANMGEESMIKSISNSTTTPHDLENDEDVCLVFYVLCESVAHRLREHGFRCNTVQIYIRDNELFTFERQAKFRRPTHITSELAAKAAELFRTNYSWQKPIRSLGVRAADLIPVDSCTQLTFFDDEQRRMKQEQLEDTIDALRRRFGHHCIQRAVLIKDRPLGDINPEDDPIIHSIGFFKEGELS